jgi:hypothetical protein
MTTCPCRWGSRPSTTGPSRAGPRPLRRTRCCRHHHRAWHPTRRRCRAAGPVGCWVPWVPGASGGEEQAVPAAVGEVFDGRVALAGVGLEAQRQMPAAGRRVAGPGGLSARVLTRERCRGEQSPLPGGAGRRRSFDAAGRSGLRWGHQRLAEAEQLVPDDRGERTHRVEGVGRHRGPGVRVRPVAAGGCRDRRAGALAAVVRDPRTRPTGASGTT